MLQNRIFHEEEMENVSGFGGFLSGGEESSNLSTFAQPVESPSSAFVDQNQEVFSGFLDKENAESNWGFISEETGSGASFSTSTFSSAAVQKPEIHEQELTDDETVAEGSVLMNWGMVRNVVKEVELTGFLPQKILEEEVEVSMAGGFTTLCKDPVEREKRLMEDLLEQKLMEQKILLMKDFELVLEKQHLEAVEKTKNQFVESKDQISLVIDTYRLREETLRTKLNNMFKILTKKREYAVRVQEGLAQLKEKYSGMLENYKKEFAEILAKKERDENEMIVSLGIGGGDIFDDIDLHTDLVFGNQWFDDNLKYDQHDLKNLATGKLEGNDHDVEVGGSGGGNKQKFRKLKRLWQKIVQKMNILSSDVREIEARFGKLIGTYFRLFRTQVIVNNFAGLVVCMAYIPHIILRFIERKYFTNNTFLEMLPDMENTYFVPTFLSFQSFSRYSQFAQWNKIIFFLMVVPSFFIFTLTLLGELVIEKKFKTEYEIRTGDIQKLKFQSFFLNIVDHRIHRKKQYRVKLYEDMLYVKYLLHQVATEERINARNWLKRFEICGLVVLIITVVITWGSLIFLDFAKESFDEWMPVLYAVLPTTLSSLIQPLAVNVITGVSPKIVEIVTDKFEVYDSEAEKVKTTILRLFSLKIVTIVLICLQYVQKMERRDSSFKKMSVIDNPYNQNDCLYKTVGDDLFTTILSAFAGELIGGVSTMAKYFFKVIKEQVTSYIAEMKRKRAEKRAREIADIWRNSALLGGGGEVLDGVELTEVEVIDKNNGNSEEEEEEVDNQDDGEDERLQPPLHLPPSSESESEEEEECDESNEENGEEMEGEVDFESEGEEEEIDELEVDGEGEGGESVENPKEEDEKKEESDVEKKDEDQPKKKVSIFKKLLNKFKKKKKDKKKKVVGDKKKVFETHQFLISLLYFQVLVWISLPFFPLSITVSGFLSYVIFKYQAFILKKFQKRDNSPIGAGDLGNYFIWYYLITYFIPIGMYYYAASAYRMDTICGFSVSSTNEAIVVGYTTNSSSSGGNETTPIYMTYPAGTHSCEEEQYNCTLALSESSSLMTVWRDLASSGLWGNFNVVFDRVVTNTMLLYMIVIVGFLIFYTRNSQIDSLKENAARIAQRNKRDATKHKNELLSHKSEMENLTKKCETLESYRKAQKK